MEAKPPVPVNVDEYILAFPQEVQAVLRKVRETVRSAAPDAEETISHRMPALRQHGVLVYYAAFKGHIGFYPPITGDAALEQAAAPYAGEKGNLRFPLNQPIPYGLIHRLTAHRAAQDRAKASAASSTRAVAVVTGVDVPRFFKTASAFRAWLARNESRESELIVGFYKRGSGKPSMTWSESVDEALCHGWIDGVRTKIDEASYKIRFTPRKPTSTWSAVNIEKMRVLEAQGRMTDAGRRALALRSESRSRIYAYEQREEARLSPQHEAEFRMNEAAWSFFERQPPGYRHLAAYRIASARKPETKSRRLAQLIEASARGQRV